MTLKWVAPMALMVSSVASACNNYNTMEVTAPAERFTLQADGTAVDRLTNLMWARCTLGHDWDGATSDCVPVKLDHNYAPTPQEEGYYTWAGALQAAETSTYAQHTDWRLPNAKELASIVEVSCSLPALNTKVFPSFGRTWELWSSTPAQSFQTHAWALDPLGDLGVVDRYNAVSRTLMVRDMDP